MPNRSSSLAVGAVAGSVAGFIIGRASNSLQIRRTLGGNFKILNAEERRVARTLLGHGQGYLLRSWAKPGVNDGAKRQLLAAAASYLEGAGEGLEAARLACLEPPAAAKQPKEVGTHGDNRLDNYYWLRDDERKAPAVLSYLAAENSYTSAAMSDTEALQAELYKEMRERIQEADTSVATRYQGFYYFTRTEEGQQYGVHCRRAVPAGATAPSEADGPSDAAPEEVILDENQRKIDGKHTFYMVGCCETSPNQELLAWTEDTVGGEKYTLRVKNISSGEELMEAIPNTSGDVVWANDNATLFYVVKDPLDRPYRVFRHAIGTPSSQDVLVFEENDESFWVGIDRSHSDKLIYIHTGSTITSETRFISADAPTDDFKVILPRTTDVEYSVSHHPGSGSSGSSGTCAAGATGWFVISYRAADLPNSELRVAPVDKPEQQTVLLPHRPDVKLTSASVGRRWLVVNERSRALKTVVVHRLPPSGAMPTELGEGIKVVFDEPAYTLSGGLTGDFDSEVLRLSYSSLTTPPSVFDQHMSTGKRALKKVQPILGGFNKDDYVTERLWATAEDGVEVPISLVYRKGLAKKDGSDPLLLHGYGSYEMPYDASFSRDQLSLIDRGWTVAIAHIRGGGDMGRMWYEDGKFLKKKNTFTDFIACAEHLMKEGFTSSDRLAIEGRSAGGLLMGAVINMRPDLFASVLMGVPFVDCLTTMLDETIPLTIVEWEEWGDPRKPEFYEYMKSYSPVDNIRPQNYPNILVTAGLHDPRVGYWEPAKLVAKLRAVKTDNHLLVFKCELGAGHFSVTGRFERLKETAFEYAFLLKTFGMLGSKPKPGSAAAADGKL